MPCYFLPFICIFQKATGTSEEVFPDVTSGTDVAAAPSVPPMVGIKYSPHSHTNNSVSS